MKSAAVLALLLLAAPAQAITLQSDCRGVGSIGDAYMAADGTGAITVNIHNANGGGGVAVYKRGDPAYARVISHLGGLLPGQHKNMPPFC